MNILSFLFSKKGRPSAIGKQVKLRAEEFIISYGEHYKGLDYSQQSLIVLDRLLDDYSQQWKDLSSEKKNEVVTNASSYILWVACRQYGGNFYWSEEEQQPVLVIGEPDYRVATMPQNKVSSRIEQGDSHNIIIYYRKIAESIQQATNNSNILV
jgi:hypothetical protein